MFLNFYRFTTPIASLVTLLAFTASIAWADAVTLTSVKGWPNERTSNDPPPNAIDGNTNTFTWTTESFASASPSYLGVGFNSTGVGRIRLWKTPEGGGGPNIKNLVIQYTNDSSATALDLRAWSNVSGLASGHLATELLNASAVNANGTVTGDVHNSPGPDGWGSLTFAPVQATGIRIAFSNPSGTGLIHYRVGEFEVHSAEVPEPSALAFLMLGLFAGISGRVRVGRSTK